MFFPLHSFPTRESSLLVIFMEGPPNITEQILSRYETKKLPRAINYFDEHRHHRVSRCGLRYLLPQPLQIADPPIQSVSTFTTIKPPITLNSDIFFRENYFPKHDDCRYEIISSAENTLKSTKISPCYINWSINCIPIHILFNSEDPFIPGGSKKYWELRDAKLIRKYLNWLCKDIDCKDIKRRKNVYIMKVCIILIVLPKSDERITWVFFITKLILLTWLITNSYL